MIQYQVWSRGDFKNVIRREMMDTNTRWWSDGDLNLYLDMWLQELQQEFEFVWAVNTLTIGTVTSTQTYTVTNQNGTFTNTSPPQLVISTATFTPGMLRNEAVYYNGFRLAGRLLQDLEVGDPLWRGDLGNGTSAASDSNPSVYDTPRVAVMYPDSQNILIWPCPQPPGSIPPGTNSNVFIFEYPAVLTFGSDAGTSGLPVWTQWCAKPWVCMKLYQRPGPINDPRRALRYKAQYERAKLRVRRMWDSFAPERFRRLQPGRHYEWEILTPPPAWDCGTNTAQGTSTTLSTYVTPVIVGTDGTFNSSAYLGMNLTVGANPVYVTALGRYMRAGNSQTHLGYILSGSNILGTATLSMAGGTVGSFVYGSCGVSLTPGGVYDVLFAEFALGDTSGRDATTTIATTRDIVYNYSENNSTLPPALPIPPENILSPGPPNAVGPYNIVYYTF